jgi:hypothetical protein
VANPIQERKKMHKTFWTQNLSRRNDLRDLDVDGRILMKVIFGQMVFEDVDYIQLAAVRWVHVSTRSSFGF